MRKPYPLKIVEQLDERVSIQGDEIELGGIVLDVRRAERLAAWLFNAVAWIKEQERSHDSL